MDSCDHYAGADITKKYSTTGNSALGVLPTINATGGRRGSASLRFAWGSSSNPTTYVQKVLAPGDATCIAGFSIRITPAHIQAANGMAIFSVRDGGSPQASLRINQNGTLSACRNASSSQVVLGTTTTAIASGAHTHIEVRIVIHDTTGEFQIRINGELVLNLTAVDTKNTANTAYTGFALGPLEDGYVAVLSQNFDIDDVYVLDGTGAAPWNTFLGDCRVDARYPTGAGATTGWAPSAGANWQCVDDATPNDDTDYTLAASAGLVDTFVVQDAPVAGAAIYGIQHCIAAKKSDAGIATIAPVVRHGGADFVGADQYPSTGYTYLLAIAAVNPGTLAAWTEAGFNGAEFGYKRTV